MTILKKNPFSFSHGALDSFFSEFSLPLAKRDHGEIGFEACFLSQISDFYTRVCTWT